MNGHTYDIIIPVYHAGEGFGRLLELLRRQAPAPRKIILMETLEEGEEPQLWEGCEVHPVRKRDFDHAGTRRLGVSWSGADAFLMMTQDAVPQDETLAGKLLQALYPEEEVQAGVKHKTETETETAAEAESEISAETKPKSSKETKTEVIAATEESQETAEEEPQISAETEIPAVTPAEIKTSAGMETRAETDRPEEKNRSEEKNRPAETDTEKKKVPPCRSESGFRLDGSGEVLCEDYVRLLREHEKEWEGAKASRRGTAMAYARQLPAEHCAETERFSRSFNYPAESCVKTAADLPRLGIRTFFASDVCCMYDRNTYETLNGFVPSAGFNEDMLYAAAAVKAGFSVAYAAEAACIHSHSYSLSEQFHRNFDNGMSQAMHPEVFEGIRSEKEGLRFVKGAAGYLLRIGKPWLLPGLCLQSAAKYLGFRLGKSWEKLPERAVRCFALNKCFVDRVYREKQKADMETSH